MKRLDGENAPRTELISATVLQVLSPGGDGLPWHALVHVADDHKSAYVRLDTPPAGLRPGDDIHLGGVRRPSGRDDIPDEITVATGDAEARIALMASSQGPVAMVPSDSQTGTSPTDMMQRLGLSTLAAAARRGWVNTEESGGVVGVVRSRTTMDPALEWGMQRFGGENGRGGPITMLVEPMALLPQATGRDFPSAIKRFANAFQSMFPKSGNSLMPNGSNAEINESVFSSMPALHGPERYGAIETVQVLKPQSREGAPNSTGKGAALRLVIPYNSFWTSSEFGSNLSHFSSAQGFPFKKFVPSEARARMVTAHELAHTRQAEYGFVYGDLAERNACECFADATSIICHVLEQGDVASVTALADMRSISALNGVASHSTGPACHAAIDVAVRMRSGPVAANVPLDQILQAARDISHEYALPNPKDIIAICKELNSLHPAWKSMTSDAMMDAVTDAIEGAGISPDSLAAGRFIAAVEALTRICYLPRDLENPDVRDAALEVERQDIADTADYLTRSGMGSMIPRMLQTASKANAASLEAAQAIDKDLSLSRLRSVFPKLADWAVAGDIQDSKIRGVTQKLSDKKENTVEDESGIPDLSMRKVMQITIGKIALKTVDLVMGPPTSPVSMLAYERKSLPPLRAMLDYIVRPDVREAAPTGLVSVLEQAETHPDRGVFDAPLVTRLRTMGELLWQEHELLKRYLNDPEDRGEQVVVELNTLRTRVQKLAFSVRVQSHEWSTIVANDTVGESSAFERLREDRRITAADLSDPNAFLKPSDAPRLLPLLQKLVTGGEMEAHQSWQAGKGGGRLDWSGRDLRWMNLHGMDLSGGSLAGADLRGVDLSQCNLDRVNRTGAKLHDEPEAPAAAPAVETGSLPLNGTVSSYRNDSGWISRHAVINGASRLHCEDDYAVVGPDGSGKAFLMGAPAVVVAYDAADGTPMTTRLVDARDIDGVTAVLRHGASAKVIQPTPDHFLAIQAANAMGQLSGDVSLGPDGQKSPRPTA